ncbi:hypothetical protein PPL_07501 [Heterostelium album PN500]|uniref:Uncharacterized protein n=1 Tax=Heterostelium pallidum (strain ATCC 26659 / Pp 5 / PN500) TaxID=670386 RepID=D3BG50_HETP5|nr:hypothetical protein PPL_07501 [Heterostelium album PN500]EFA79642.1 hypothetical protein PPL_07501 [Heterostelium album PN500]|eukprot:XP_020431763.1 hypothetical protein PPL_07501 [Heterostelium album PN500]
MGSSYFKGCIFPEEIKMNIKVQPFPKNVVNQELVLDTYLGISTGKDSSGTSTRHYFVLVDIRGESNDELVIGMEFHLNLPNHGTSLEVGFSSCRGCRSSSHTKLIRLGKLPSVILEGSQQVDCTKPSLLCSWALARYNFFIENVCNGETVWGSELQAMFIPGIVDIFADFQETKFISKN